MGAEKGKFNDKRDTKGILMVLEKRRRKELQDEGRKQNENPISIKLRTDVTLFWGRKAENKPNYYCKNQYYKNRIL